MQKIIKNICCIGAGYVGGPTMAVIANKCKEININVVDINPKRIKSWNSKDLNKLPIYEPGLAEIIEKCRWKNLHFSIDIKENIKQADMIFISVNTPTKKEGIGAGKASDLSFIEAAARLIAEYSKSHTIIVEKSTLPVKTAEKIQQILKSACKKNNNLLDNSPSFDVLSNPEFLSEGNAINDLNNPDRILIGGESDDAIKCLKNIYMNWVDESKIITTNLWSSELSKLAANAFLAQRISSINSLSALCEASGANIEEVRIAVGTDARIGNQFLNPGPGFGGSCFKKDILNLVYLCEFYGLYEVANYWNGVLNINKWQKNRITAIIFEKLFSTITGKNIAILGFSFKSETNDTRESPAIEICQQLLREGANLKIYDPKVSEKQIVEDLNSQDDLEKNSLLGSWKFSNDVYEAIEDTDALVILTEWKEFSCLNWQLIAEKMRFPAWVFDTRSIVDITEAKSNGLNVWKLGNA